MVARHVGQLGRDVAIESARRAAASVVAAALAALVRGDAMDRDAPVARERDRFRREHAVDDAGRMELADEPAGFDDDARCNASGDRRTTDDHDAMAARAWIVDRRRRIPRTLENARRPAASVVDPALRAVAQHARVAPREL